jgi:hypothetical protein
LRGDHALGNNDSLTTEAAGRLELSNGQYAPTKLVLLLEDIAVDALAFEYMGLMMIALCFVVIALPSLPQPSRRDRNR